MLGALQC